MAGKKLHIILLALIGMMLSSCNINRFIPEGKALVKKNKVVIENEYKDVSKSDLSNYIADKPYKNFWQTNYKTCVYFKANASQTASFGNG